MSDVEVKNTPLAECHKFAGARMVPFSGWNMPVQYSDGILAEHKHTREKAGLFDICHMGEFRVTGEKAVEALDAILRGPYLISGSAFAVTISSLIKMAELWMI